ncbi:MAG: HD domain-containing protein, partial [Planctomycetales bacterium]|nr:HD domain-containing protein [Planctomycetales bacterium]
MADATPQTEFINPPASPSVAPAPVDRQQVTESRVAEISSLLAALEEAAAESGLKTPPPEAVQPAPIVSPQENHLAEARLGLASSLYSALSRKHPQTASHSLRVALGCSSWALYESMDDELRDVLEVAALLHDIGKLGVPDRILLKPGRLTDAEQTTVLEGCSTGWEVLTGSCRDQRVLSAVRFATRRYDGQGSNDGVSGEQIPLSSRMIAIVDAFDSMTTEQVYRKARSRDQALAELMDAAGSQFDPGLVQRFARVLNERQDLLTERVAARWLGELSSGKQELPWADAREAAAAGTIAPSAPVPEVPVACETPVHFEQGFTSESIALSAPANVEFAAMNLAGDMFQQKLIDAMHDGVMFVDSQATIFLWSKGAERLTGVSSAAACGRTFMPTLLDMCTA